MKKLFPLLASILLLSNFATMKATLIDEYKKLSGSEKEYKVFQEKLCDAGSDELSQTDENQDTLLHLIVRNAIFCEGKLNKTTDWARNMDLIKPILGNCKALADKKNNAGETPQSMADKQGGQYRFVSRLVNEYTRPKNTNDHLCDQRTGSSNENNTNYNLEICEIDYAGVKVDPTIFDL